MQSGNPAASGGRVEPLEVVEVVVEVALPLALLLPVAPGVSSRTCLVALSQHLIAPEVALGDLVVVVVEV